LAIERERRWLVRLSDIPAEVLAASSEHITQGYLNPLGVLPVFRIRLIRESSGLEPHSGVQTVKAPRAGGDGAEEIEFDLPVCKAVELMSLQRAGLTKVRHTYPFEEVLALELDFFEGEYLEGMVVVEIELPSFDYPLLVPDWFGPEVTGIRELSNVAMAFFPEKARAVFDEIWAKAHAA
jgi:adenylate cyclase